MENVMSRRQKDRSKEWPWPRVSFRYVCPTKALLNQNARLFSIGDVKCSLFILRFRRCKLDSFKIPFPVQIHFSDLFACHIGVNRGSGRSPDTLPRSLNRDVQFGLFTPWDLWICTVWHNGIVTLFPPLRDTRCMMTVLWVFFTGP